MGRLRGQDHPFLRHVQHQAGLLGLQHQHQLPEARGAVRTGGGDQKRSRGRQTVRRQRGGFKHSSIEAAAAAHPGQAVAEPLLQRGGPGEGTLRGRGIPGLIPRLGGQRRRVRGQREQREQRERFEGGGGGQGPDLAGVPAERYEAPSDGEEEGGAEEAQEVSGVTVERLSTDVGE